MYKRSIQDTRMFGTIILYLSSYNQCQVHKIPCVIK